VVLVLSGYGGPDRARLQQHSPPVPGPTQLLVEVRAAGLNPVDYKTREGKLKPVLKLRLPVVMGNELSGEVISASVDVRKLKAGDRIFARLAKGALGAFAEKALVDEYDAALMPKSLDFGAAGSIDRAAGSPRRAEGEARRSHHDRRWRDYERVAVSRSLRHALGRSGAAGAGIVLDDDGPAECPCHVVADDAGNRVRRPSGRERNDQGDVAFWEIGRCRDGAC
jgi:alcohol dehydrogenase-like protein